MPRKLILWRGHSCPRSSSGTRSAHNSLIYKTLILKHLVLRTLAGTLLTPALIPQHLSTKQFFGWGTIAWRSRLGCAFRAQRMKSRGDVSRWKTIAARIHISIRSEETNVIQPMPIRPHKRHTMRLARNAQQIILLLPRHQQPPVRPARTTRILSAPSRRS